MAAQKQLGENPAPVPIYIPHHKMAPAPPRNEPSDWLAPQRPCRVRRPCPARLRRARKSAESLQPGGGSGLGRQLESPRNAPSGGTLWGRRKRRCFFSVPVSEFHAAFRLRPQSRLCWGASSFPHWRLCAPSCPRPRYVLSGPLPQFSALPLGCALSPSLAGHRGPGPAPFGREGGLARRLPVPGGAGLHFPAG